MTAVLPQIDDVNRPFWDGCRERRLLLQRCTPCSHLRYPISTICPRCLSSSYTWEATGGHGTVYSFAVFRHAYNDAWRDQVPYAVALVELDEGPTMISNIVGTEVENVRVGLPVRVVFEPASDEITVPRFSPD
ncbi:MAG TPA: OB-fold domain-containing protein [Solirubrobacteraceae bacterium]|jgi:hypothetical protein|nr:OB-fold domain-containing protein [Solirubrobacteraceae bacterium]